MVDICDEIAEDESVSVQLVPQGYYAVMDVQCPPLMLNRMWDWFLGNWFTTSKLMRRNGIYYEHFPEFGKRAVTALYGAQLCVPIEAPASAF